MPDVRMPDGTVIRNVPANATRAQIQAAYDRARQAGKVADSRPTSFWRGVAENVSRAADNLTWLNDAMQGRTIAKSLTGAPIASDVARAQTKQTSQNSPTRGSTAGNIVGGLIGTLPSFLVPGGVVAQGAAGGALLTDDPNNTAGLLTDATVGGIGGKVGQQAGKRVIAPIAERVGRTAPARAVSKAVVDAVNKVTNGNKQQLPLPQFTPTDVAVNRMAPDVAAARQVAADASRLKLPVAMADVDPRLQQLSGSVARHSPDARALAEQTFNPRALGQADRAVNAIDEHLAPVTDIRARGDQIMAEGKPAYDPLYQQAYEAPAISSPKLDDLLNRPAGRQAVGRANTIAANEGRDPKAMGFSVDEAGNVVLHSPPVPAMDRLQAAREGWDSANQAYQDAVARQRASLSPSGAISDAVTAAEGKLAAANAELDAAKGAFQKAPRSGTVVDTPGYTTQSLDYTKRGLDDLLEPYRNPISGKLVLDEGGRAINGVKNDLLSEMDHLNPAYGEARASYGRFAQRREALNTGHDVLPNGGLPERDFNAIVGRATPDTLPELQRGYATSMADQANRARLSANPYSTIYGSPNQQTKVGALFPEGASDFGRIADIESLMAQTRTKALGGSQTQANKAADDLFQNDAANAAVDGAMQAITGGGVPGATKIVGMMGRKFLGSRDLGVIGAEKKASALAPMLFDTSNPNAIVNYLDDLARKRLEQEVRRNAYQRSAGIFGRSLGTVPAVALGTTLSQ